MPENARSYGNSPPHGSMSEEAAKLVEVAQLWLASQSGRDGREVWAEATAEAAAEDHVPAECRGCPICRVRRVLSDVSPEVYEHLAEAVSALGAAIRALDSSRRRRPPMSLTIGVDVGGTKVAGGLVDGHGKVLAQHRVDTPARDAEATTTAIVSVIEALRAEHDVEAVGIGIAGFVDAARSKVYFAPNLLGWRDGPLRWEVEQRVGLPVVVENDANAAAWGEARFGAGREERFIVCVTVGTGVGGGIIVDRALYRGGFGVGAEIGHIQMVENGRQCGCGQRGCWEQYASGGALVRDARERAAESRADAEILLGLGDGTPEGIAGEHVTAAAQQGDPVAKASFDALGHWLGQGLADLAAVLDPECFVLGGGVSEAGALVLDPTISAFEQLLTGRGRRPTAQVVLAQLGNDAGMVGAADLARRL